MSFIMLSRDLLENVGTRGTHKNKATRGDKMSMNLLKTWQTDLAK